ncbi:PEP-CTERM sorting domain-containing protein [Egbenema bharatensis]|uniref:PEP-CTERM sorting domain-containing protein n=1 Tax=Egbenema bharatensis TaxID=3463334 RepID=UPI003A89F534
MNRMKRHLFSASLIAISALSLSAMSASAASLSCSNGSVTANGFGSATACAGSFTGNDTGASSTLLADLNGGLFSSYVGTAQWSLFGKSDDGNNSFTASNNQTSGTWQLLNAITQPFVISFKAGNAYSAYLFDGSTPITSGTFDTLGVSVNGKGNARDLSHASIFIANVAPKDNNNVEVPEPGMMAALGMVAIGGLGVLRKKKA